MIHRHRESRVLVLWPKRGALDCLDEDVRLPLVVDSGRLTSMTQLVNREGFQDWGFQKPDSPG